MLKYFWKSLTCSLLPPRVLQVELDHTAPTLLALTLADLGLQGVTSLLGVPEQHCSVGLVEDGVVNSCVSHTQGTFHHNHLEWEKM